MSKLLSNEEFFVSLLEENLLWQSKPLKSSLGLVSTALSLTFLDSLKSAWESKACYLQNIILLILITLTATCHHDKISNGWLAL
jgi:hypothetical protein